VRRTGSVVPPGPEAPGEGLRAGPEAGAAQRTGGLGRAVLRTLVENRLAAVGVGIVVVLTLFCFIGPLLYRTNQVSTNLAQVDLPPSLAHPLGTDQVGYDELGRLMVGGQSSIEIGLAAAMLATALGVAWGAVAGYFGGVVDAVMMRVVDAGIAIPPLFLVLFLAAVVVPSVPVLIVVVAMVFWLVPARLVRGETLSLRTREYVQAVRAMGAGAPRVIARHVVPNAIGTIVVNATFNVADAILLVAYVSYLGLGPPPPATSWGAMLSNGLNFVYSGSWWLVYPPGLAIVALVMAFNFIGDALRDALEVRIRR
jgi:peptide/nickel transport system permease protein